MKRLFITLPMILVASMANAQSCSDSNHPHAIDLGLPSGTKWACCNVESINPEDYGGYYAWGETKEKEKYDWYNYIHCDGSMETCHDIGSDIAGSEYDVAHVLWGGSWVMPSQSQFQELVSSCSYTWITKNGVEGGLFIGPSGGSIFMPAANIRWNGFLECLVLGGYYWSSTQDTLSYCTYRLIFDNWGGDCRASDLRGIGLTVRPVINGINNNVIRESSTDSADAIDAIENDASTSKQGNGSVFDLTGRRLTTAPQHGIYIQDGRKVFK